MIRTLLWALLVLPACSGPSTAPAQPLPFDHSLHVNIQVGEEKLRCVACHTGVDKGDHAGLPPLTTCLRCHMRPQGDPPSEKESRVRTAVAEGGPFRWIQVTRNPGHVFFSHAAHVSLAKIECAECHGDVASWSEPPTRPEARLLSMRKCMSCHRDNGAPNTCGTCHQ